MTNTRLDKTPTAQRDTRKLQRRIHRLRHLARRANLQRKSVARQLETTCADLTAAYRALSGRMSLHRFVIEYQQELLSACDHDDVFRSLFRTYVRRSGSVAGMAFLCDSETQMRLIGRFGVPYPDSIQFCEQLSQPVIDAAVAAPACQLIDAGEQAEMFDESIHKYLTGVSILGMPLVAGANLIGLVVLYRKGEQPFTDDDVALAEAIASPTAIAVRRSHPHMPPDVPEGPEGLGAA